jgi:hypothetical protein
MKLLPISALMLAGFGCVRSPSPMPEGENPGDPAGAESQQPRITKTLATDEKPLADMASNDDKNMSNMGSGTEASENAGDVYVCPMHPDVTSDQPGKCPKCGMSLVKKDKQADGSHHEHAQ